MSQGWPPEPGDLWRAQEEWSGLGIRMNDAVLVISVLGGDILVQGGITMVVSTAGGIRRICANSYDISLINRPESRDSYRSEVTDADNHTSPSPFPVGPGLGP